MDAEKDGGSRWNDALIKGGFFVFHIDSIAYQIVNVKVLVKVFYFLKILDRKTFMQYYRPIKRTERKGNKNNDHRENQLAQSDRNR